MIFRGHIACFLSLICLWMLVVPVIPHHHHADGMLCMKNDIASACCPTHTSEGKDTEHCCCNTGCITTHFFQQAPSPTDDTWSHPAVFSLLSDGRTHSSFSAPDTNNLHSEEEYPTSCPLYDKYRRHALGMRAPPTLA